MMSPKSLNTHNLRSTKKSKSSNCFQQDKVFIEYRTILTNKLYNMIHKSIHTSLLLNNCYHTNNNGTTCMKTQRGSTSQDYILTAAIVFLFCLQFGKILLCRRFIRWGWDRGSTISRGWVASWRRLISSWRGLVACWRGLVACWRWLVACWSGWVACWRGWVTSWRGWVASWRGWVASWRLTIASWWGWVISSRRGVISSRRGVICCREVKIVMICFQP